MTRPEHIEAVFDTVSDCAANGGLRLRIRGACMAPSMSDGDTVTVRRAGIILPGDVVVFRRSDTLVAHRVLGWATSRDGFGVVTQGDHCDHHDGVIVRSRLLGRVETSVSLGDRSRAFARFLQHVFRKLVRR